MAEDTRSLGSPPVVDPVATIGQRVAGEGEESTSVSLQTLQSLISSLSETMTLEFSSLRSDFAGIHQRLSALEVDVARVSALASVTGQAERTAPSIPVPPEAAITAPAGIATPADAAPTASTPYVPPQLRGGGAGPSSGRAVSSRPVSGTVPIARNPHVPLSSFGLPEAARAWADQKTIRMAEFPRIGRGQGELPFGRWQISVYAASDAVRLSPILQQEFPSEGTSVEQEYYQYGNALLFQGLFRATAEVPVLCDVIARLYGDPSSSYSSWLAIRDHFVRVSANRESYLLGKVRELEPREGEHMESFLNRCAALQTDFVESGLVLEDRILIAHVFTCLSAHWKTRAGLDRPLSDLTWAEVARGLQSEDTARRQSDLRSREALLPLGFAPRSDRRHQDGGARSVESAPLSRTTSPARPRSFGPGGRSGGAGLSAPQRPGGSRSRSPPVSRSPGPHSRSRDQRPRSPQASAMPLVCWHCKKTGHPWTSCPTRASGWRPTAADREEGERLRAERVAQSRADRAKAAAARSSQRTSSSVRGRSRSPSRGLSQSPSDAASEGHASGSL
jgi:hypothetical protein